jgi:rSAM/selenodomain-associated transferase 2
MADRPVLSIVVPVFHEELEIERCIEMLAAQPGIEECEIIVVDGGNGTTIDCIDKPPAPVIKIRSPQGRGAQLNQGANRSTGDLILFLHVDTRLPRNGVTLIRAALAKHEAGCFSLRIDTNNVFLKAINLFSSLRSSLNRIPYGDQGYFIRKDTFFRLGGFPEQALMEDVDLMIKLKRKGIALKILPQTVLTSDRRWAKEGVFFGTIRNQLLFNLYRSGVPVQKLKRFYKTQSELLRSK